MSDNKNKQVHFSNVKNCNLIEGDDDNRLTDIKNQSEININKLKSVSDNNNNNNQSSVSLHQLTKGLIFKISKGI